MNEDKFHLGIKGLIRNGAGKILLLKVNPLALKKHTEPYWDLPGGRIQKGETVEVALAREVVEETGIKKIRAVKEVGMVLSNIRIPIGDDDVGLILAIYECTVNDKAKITISEEHTEYRWFSPKKAGELLKVKYPSNFTKKISRL